ncbi:hypothetical protein Aph01nite_54510 [Acrocarpospora phusangensis]|uniref:Protein translocase subunit SecA n=1 Tax=Acrocarpospora phusangensis TaxID=1070424 RepID=A0A919QFV9_9ACTN|nr:SEC-C metal-binding domain-containing protein [Acrocarpospora phusangensis]GIH27141.1 hypothetical protein Aph01nite_54510 [Acrocarpospora phusangensis]
MTAFWSILAVFILIVVITFLVRRQRAKEKQNLFGKHLRVSALRQGIPTVGSVHSLADLGVTRSRGRKGAGFGPYVSRDQDEVLDRAIQERPFVVIIGDSKAGKTRMAAEAIRRHFRSRKLIYPRSGEAIAALLDSGVDFAHSVVWLDELQRFLDHDGLERLLGRLDGPDAPAEVTILATIRADVFAGYLPKDGLDSPYVRVLDQALLVPLDVMFSEAERDRTAAVYDDPHLLAALDEHGLAEYLAAGPDLMRRLEEGLVWQPVGAVVVMVAVDWSRAGMGRPIPPHLLDPLVAHYAGALGIPVPDRQELGKALAWAREPVYAASSLLSNTSDGYAVFDYVIDHAEERIGTTVQDSVWTSALEEVQDGDEALRIGMAAYIQGRIDIAVQAFEIAVLNEPVHVVNRMHAAYNYALMLEKLDRVAEAETFYTRAAENGHGESAHAAGRLAAARGDATTAERFYRMSAEAGSTEGAYALGVLLRERGADEALRWLGQAAEAGHGAAALAAGRLTEGEVALGYYRLSAQAGHPEGAYALGAALEETDGREALRWLGQAAEQGHEEAARTAGRLAERLGDHAAAARYFTLAERGALPAVRARPARRSRTLRESKEVAVRVGQLAEAVAQLSDTALRQRIRVLRYSSGADDIPEALAIFNEAAQRLLGISCDDGQLSAAAVLHRGFMSEPAPGGSTLAAGAAAFLGALDGQSVHLMYLTQEAAERGADSVGRVLQFLGIDYGLLKDPVHGDERTTAYQASVVFGRLADFGFDYLRDSMAWTVDELVQGRGLSAAIVEDADIDMIEYADQAIMISAPDGQPISKWYREFAKIVSRLTEAEDYTVDRPGWQVDATEAGIAKIEDWFGIDNLYDGVNSPLVHHLDLALNAAALYERKKHYDIENGTVVPFREPNGEMFNSGFPSGIRQALEAKEGLAITAGSIILAATDRRAFLGKYQRLAGLGSALNAAEFDWLYHRRTVAVPAATPKTRIDHDDVCYRTDELRLAALVELVSDKHARGQPVLVDVADDDRAAVVSGLLTAAGVTHEILGSDRRGEAEILAAASAPGAVTVATQAARAEHAIAPVGPDAAALGGLIVIGSARSLYRWEDDRLRALTGRNGEPGETCFLVSLTDKLFTGVWTPSFQGDVPLSSTLLTKAIAMRQELLGAYLFDLRKQQFAYDEVQARQQEEIAAFRQQFLRGDGFGEVVDGWLLATVRAYHHRFTANGVADVEEYTAAMAELCGPRYSEQAALESGAPGGAGTELSLTASFLAAEQAWHRRAEELGPEVWFELKRRVVLSLVDVKWREHLAALRDLREATQLVRLRGGNPITEYEREAAEIFDEMKLAIQEEAVGYLFNLEVDVEADAAVLEEPQVAEVRPYVPRPKYLGPGESDAKDDRPPLTSEQRALRDAHGDLERNAPCPCGSGKKYKRCHGVPEE